MAEHNLLGKTGEDLAVDLLQSKGYEILARNWHSGHKELDIVARNRNWLVIAEVKTRSSEDYLEPWQAVTPQKIRRIVQAAHHYVRQTGTDLPVRFDIISVLRQGEGFRTEHIEDAYPPPLT
ncbi:MAG: YraN family protein [Bacteroidales bacterium]|nr:YraN family protein [Bacteroidales bacterium]